ncbi:MAG: beta-ketoacyl synthase N-terminal-like domain-containing protein [Kofleriaceae bacterium]
MIAIASIGLVTAQGSVADRTPQRSPTALPWPVPARSACGVGWFARGIDPALRGVARWHALAEAALAECQPRGPIVVGSCSGGADDPAGWRTAFALGHGPIASAACASGLHALWLARRMIEAGEHAEVTVLAVDTLSPAGHANFEALRVLAPELAPWQASATGFVPGEAAVAMRLVRAARGDGLLRLIGPWLGHDLDDRDALAALAPHASPPRVARILGQGTGPAAVDARELAAVCHLPAHVPIATALARHGHTVGASGLLSVALAALEHELAAPGVALDHRPIADTCGDALILCRALGGACAVVGLTHGDDDRAQLPHAAWSAPSVLPPLRIPILRRIASEAAAHRPATPPALVLVTLDAPLVPPRCRDRRQVAPERRARADPWVRRAADRACVGLSRSGDHPDRSCQRRHARASHHDSRLRSGVVVDLDATSCVGGWMKRLFMFLVLVAACGAPATPVGPARTQPSATPAVTPARRAGDAWKVLATGTWDDTERMAQALAVVHIQPVTVGSLGATMSVPASQLAVARATLRAAGFGGNVYEPKPTTP